MKTASRFSHPISPRRVVVAAAATGALALTAALAVAHTASASADTADGYQFSTHDNHGDVTFNQLLGINNEGVIAGYIYNINSHTFTRVLVPGAPAGQAGPSLTAAAINNHGDVAGFYAKSSSRTDAFILESNGTFVTLAVPGASMTQAFGINDHDEVVGAYTVGSGSSAVTHGFTWRPGHGFTTVDDPHGMGATLINGVNNAGDLVGFYTDPAGNTDGFLATPRG